MSQTVKSSYSQQDSQASASQTSMHCNLWFASYGSSSSSSSASASSSTSKVYNDVTVALRATLVTVDRSGWFQPQFFKESGSYYHINDAVSWSKWPEGVNGMSQMTQPNQTNWDVLNQSLLPAFPVGFIICKDITIKIARGSSSDSSFQENMSDSSSKSGGILCFSYSSSNSSSSSDNSHTMFSCSDGCVIRIPGPQILGYVMQLTENDKTTKMPATLPANFFVPDADYDAVTSGSSTTSPSNAPSNALNVPSGTIQVDNKSVSSSIENALKAVNIPPSVITQVQSLVSKNLGVLGHST